MTIDFLDSAIEKIKKHTQVHEDTITDDSIELRENVFVPILKENFYLINDVKNQENICFIDGGNAEVISAPNLSVSLIRVYAGTFKDNKIADNEKVEVLSFIYTKKSDGTLQYYTDYIWLKGKLKVDSFFFNTFDKSLQTGKNRIKIQSIGNHIRRLLEIALCEKVMESLNPGDLIILDGDLNQEKTFEKDIFDKVFRKSQEKGIIISGFSKTSALLSKDGKPASILISHLAPKNSPFYYKVSSLESHPVDLFFVKLNKDTNYIFKLEIYNKVMYETAKVMSVLKRMSRDIVFLGYPYGLIIADKSARVTNNEVRALRSAFEQKLGKDMKVLRKYCNTTNAHSILDNIF